MKVEAYRNLHNNSLSVRRAGGRVFTRPQAVYIVNPKFVVQPAGRRKVIESGTKNVHAFVRGEFRTPDQMPKGWKHWKLAKYNPFVHDTFLGKVGNPVHEANECVVTTNGVYYR